MATSGKEIKKLIQQIQSQIKKIGEPSAPVGSDDYAGISGTLDVKSKYEIILKIVEPTGFLDLGSGNGDMCFAVAKIFPDISVMGIEGSQTIIDFVNAYTMPAILRRFEIPNDNNRIEMIHQNILTVDRIPLHISHLFSFAVGMPRKVIDHMLTLVENASYLKIFFFIYKSQISQELRSRFPESVEITFQPVKMYQSGGQHRLFILKFAS